ncbi:MAG TPA: glutamine--tRNA ligase/YqeY domain fusion protein [Anaerolineales bacterium]|nr:glutamine--tRNA ligase/YqeY domain fusion protein [Anaerolineales bacterium]HMV97285.1 glutamine--tRNA ligase/YqeY domain fusion protein [Anaerolineales bacterium]HMZ44233.1 glutamine--tRNA ligase/YqeY domain fusion protein [Anaerolineales bacterium]HNA55574.1 glutamine--tRNA ligase/YqeY domain fusion protein [Anaerolineales bacterium]HNB87259.1 glutamine--tRNA ligase/YqeY domain fusion protein [Anaerolineales bacterium]
MSSEEVVSRIPAFIREAVAEDLKSGRFKHIRTRLPPEPNGYLHIGHIKAFLIDYFTAKEFGGELYLRFDDTNPSKEETEFVNAIEDDAKWLGIEWAKVTFASDYFDLLYEWAVRLIKMDLAYVDDQTQEEMSAGRGTLPKGTKWSETESAIRPGVDSPYRNRPIEESLDLLERMKNGEFPEGSRVLRAKIDMTHPNILLRDPVMYRIMHVHHHRTGDKWHIYPMYDWSHGQNDSMEGVTHSLCSNEYIIHRPLYEWFLEKLEAFPSRQIEFSRLNLTYAMMSKRKLRKLVEAGIVRGWDDPRLTTLRGLRRRGVTPEAIINFVTGIGETKNDSWVEMAQFEAVIRDDLNKRAIRRMAVLNPIKLVIDNYPEGVSEELDAVNNPEDPNAGTRKVKFSKTIYIEQDDFRETPPPKYYRLYPGNEVRLRYAYFVKCTHVVKNDQGEVVEVHATYDPATHGGDSPDGRKVKSTIHWVSADHAIPAQVRMYDQLFTVERPDDGELESIINPKSLDVIENAFVEPALAEVKTGENIQFERVGYFCADPDSTPEKPVFNLTVNLKDTWAKLEKKK